MFIMFGASMYQRVQEKEFVTFLELVLKIVLKQVYLFYWSIIGTCQFDQLLIHNKMLFSVYKYIIDYI